MSELGGARRRREGAGAVAASLRRGTCGEWAEGPPALPPAQVPRRVTVPEGAACRTRCVFRA